MSLGVPQAAGLSGVHASGETLWIQGTGGNDEGLAAPPGPDAVLFVVRKAFFIFRV